MNMRALAGKAVAAVVLSASAVGGIGAVAVVTAGTADAMPREAQCIVIYQVMSDSADMAQAAYAQGDEAGGDSWMDIYFGASQNHDRYCLS
jgi:hypothetical protein